MVKSPQCLQAKLCLFLLLAETAGDKSGGSPAEDPGEKEGAERPETGLKGPEREWLSKLIIVKDL